MTGNSKRKQADNLQIAVTLSRASAAEVERHLRLVAPEASVSSLAHRSLNSYDLYSADPGYVDLVVAILGTAGGAAFVTSIVSAICEIVKGRHTRGAASPTSEIRIKFSDREIAVPMSADKKEREALVRKFYRQIAGGHDRDIKGGGEGA